MGPLQARRTERAIACFPLRRIVLDVLAGGRSVRFEGEGVEVRVLAVRVLDPFAHEGVAVAAGCVAAAGARDRDRCDAEGENPDPQSHELLLAEAAASLR